MNFGRILTMECVNTAPPRDARCSDPAFAIANPAICGVQSGLILKPGTAIACLLGSIQFKVFSVTNGIEEDVTSEAVFTSGDLNIAVIGAGSGNATGIAAGEAVITATWNGKTATGTLTVLSGDNCCEQQNIAMLLVMDSTKSMSQAFGGVYAKRLDFAKAAATRLVNEVNTSKDTIGLIEFHGSTVTVDDLPSSDDAAVLADVASLAETLDKTQFYDAVTEAIATLDATVADRKIIILVSDGEDTLTTQFNETNDPIVPLSQFKAQGGIVMCLGVRAADVGFALLSAMSTGGFFINAYPDNVEAALDYISGLKGYICAGNCTPAGDELLAKGKINYTGFTNWDVENGTLDLCGNGYFDFRPGNGLYVDMRGTAYSQEGILVSKTKFTLEAGHNYRISFDLAGNNRSDQGVQTLRVRVIPTDGGEDILDTGIGVSDYKQDFETQVLNFNAPGNVEVELSFNQIEYVLIGAPAKIGVLLDNIRFEDVTDGTLLLYDDFDSENLTYVTPGCGEGTIWTWISSIGGYGYNTGYDCEGEGCLDEPPIAQLPDPNPLSDIESGSAPPPRTYTSTKQACASCPSGTVDAGSRISPIVDAAYSKITASSESNNGTFATEAWLAFDDDPDTYWASDGSAPQWLQLQLEAAAAVATYGLRTLFVGKPTGWTLSGSNDAITWTVLDTRDNPDGTLLIENIENAFSIATPTSFLYYRLTVTSVNSVLTFPGDPVGGVYRVGIVQMSLYDGADTQICESATATSNSSQQHADQLAYEAALALAEAQLNCRAVYTSTQNYTVKCPVGCNGPDVTRSATRTSFVSQADADALAYQAAKDAAEIDSDCSGSNHEQAIIINSDGPATPYPSVKYVSDLTGTITEVKVTVYGLTHSAPADIIMVLRSPDGTYVNLMQRCGGVPGPAGIDIEFDDTGAPLPDNTAILIGGTFRPTQYGADVDLPEPAAAAPYALTLAQLFGEDPNGCWALFICDLTTLDAGIIADGWDLEITSS